MNTFYSPLFTGEHRFLLETQKKNIVIFKTLNKASFISVLINTTFHTLLIFDNNTFRIQSFIAYVHSALTVKQNLW